jgi:hypothetical protein
MAELRHDGLLPQKNGGIMGGLGGCDGQGETLWRPGVSKAAVRQVYYIDVAI